MDDTEIGMEEAGVQKSVHRYWGEIMKIKTAMGQMRFPTLVQVMVADVILPHNNVDCDRAFYVVHKVYTEGRQSCNTDTLIVQHAAPIKCHVWIYVLSAQQSQT